jgi:hypothetical protein
MKKLRKSNKAIKQFLTQTKRNYKSMKTKMKAIWLVNLFLCVLCTSCNVTRTITTECQTYRDEDKTVTITTKTVESYDASKKGGNK